MRRKYFLILTAKGESEERRKGPEGLVKDKGKNCLEEILGRGSVEEERASASAFALGRALAELRGQQHEPMRLLPQWPPVRAHLASHR